jgi:hypothetical protein
MKLLTTFEFWDSLPPELQIEILGYCYTAYGLIYLQDHSKFVDDIFVPLFGTDDDPPFKVV